MRLEEFLETNTKIKTFAAGEDIFAEGEQAGAAYYIIEGRVEIYKGPPGPESRMAELGPDEIFGEMALLRYDKYTLSARALEETKAYVILPEILHEQLRAAHPLVRALLDMLVERIHNVNEVLIDIDQVETL